jgi:hypothetical protein
MSTLRRTCSRSATSRACTFPSDRHSQALDRRSRVAAETSTADGVGDNPKALAELVDEAKEELPVDNGEGPTPRRGTLKVLSLTRPPLSAGVLRRQGSRSGISCVQPHSRTHPASALPTCRTLSAHTAREGYPARAGGRLQTHGHPDQIY